MAGIRQRKKNLILAGLTGALLTGLPLLGLTVFFAVENLAVRQEVEEYQKQEETADTCMIYLLNKKKERGEVLEKRDIAEVEITGNLSGVPSCSLKGMLGKQMKLTAEAGTMLSESLLAADALPQEDERRLELDYVRIPELLNQGELIDIRVHFENGEDYIVAGKKRVLSIQREDGYGTGKLLEVQVSEEEILKLASVKADYDRYDNTLVYAVVYAEEGQAQAVDTYPVNPAVYALSTWDSNVVKRVLTIENQEKRRILEENLFRFYSGEDRNPASADSEA